MTQKTSFGRVSMRVLTVACTLAFGAAALPHVMISDAVAQDKDKKAPKGPAVSAKIGKPLKAAQDAIAAKNWKEAKAKIEEANAMSDKTPYDSYAIAQLMGYVQISTQDWAGAAKSFEVTYNSEFTPAGEKAAQAKTLTQLYAQAKNYPKVIQYGPTYLKDNPGDAQMQQVVGQAYYLQNDFPNAAKYLKQAIEAADKSGKAPEENWIQLLMSAEYEQNNVPGLTKALERIVTTYPKPNYWDQLIQLQEKEINASGKFDLEIYRLRLQVGAKLEPGEYREIAELAIQAGLPGEAEKAMAAAAAAGATTERDARLSNMAKTQASTDKNTLAESEKAAQSAGNGEALVKTGEAYLTYGNPTKAVELIKAGIAKGPKDADRAKLRLGVAQLEAKQTAEAKKTFNSVTATTPWGKLAKLWALASR
jgi:hypothetical protein